MGDFSKGVRALLALPFICFGGVMLTIAEFICGDKIVIKIGGCHEKTMS